MDQIDSTIGPVTDTGTNTVETDPSGLQFQVKLLLILLHRACRHGYSFRIGVVSDPGTSDDRSSVDDLLLVLQTAERPKSEFAVVHVLGSPGGERAIGTNELTAATGGFSMVKQFVAYQELKQSEAYRNGTIANWIVCGRGRLVDPSQVGIVLRNERKVHDVWKMRATGDGPVPGYYRVVKLPPDAIERLKRESDAHRLATGLAEHLFNYQPVNLGSPVIRRYYRTLVGERIVDADKLHHDFVKNVDLSAGAQEFRAAFQESGLSILAERRPVKWGPDRSPATAFWAKAKGKQLPVAAGTSRHPDAFPMPDLEADIDDFRRKVLLAVSLPDAGQLATVIRNEIGDGYRSLDDPSNCQRTVHYLCKWTLRSRSHFLPFQAGRTVFDNVRQQLQKWELIGHRHRSADLFKCVDHFRDVGPLRRMLRSHDAKYVQLRTDSSALCTIKVAQAVKEWPEDSHAIVDVHSLVRLRSNLQSAFQSREKFLLVIECVGEGGRSAAAGQLLTDLLRIVASTTNKQIVLILGPDDHSLGEVDDGDVPVKRVRHHVGSFRDLTDEFQSVIAAADVRFQGAPVKLRDLVSRDAFDEVVTVEAIDKMVNGIDVVSGRLVASSLPSGQLPRELHLHLAWTKECLVDASPSDLLVVSGASKFDLSRFVPLHRIGVAGREPPTADVAILTVDPRSEPDLESLARRFPGRNVHLLRKHGRHFVWQRSGGASQRQSEDRLLTTTVNVLAGAPGSGRTTVLARLSSIDKRDRPSNWVICIDLSESVHLLTGVGSIDDVVRFLAAAEGLTTELDRRLLRHQLRTPGRVSIYLTGFDQIGTGHQQTVIKMLQLLKTKTSIGKVWLTVKWTSVIESEDDLSEHRFGLVPLSPQHQIRLLRRFRPQMTGDQVEAVIRSLSSPGTDHLRRFLGTPLLLGAIAETVDSGIPTDPLDLYERLTLVRCGRQWPVDAAVSKELDHCRHVHEQLAVRQLFPSEWPRLFGGSDVGPEDLDLLLDIGLVSERNGTVRFVHRTLADYFAAEFFARVLRNQKPVYSRHRTVVDLLTTALLDEVHDTLRLFLDHRLARGSAIHEAALSGDQERMTALERDDLVVIFQSDVLGRRPIHLAVAYGHEEVTDFLLRNADSYNKGPAHLTTIDVFGLSALSYAIASSGLTGDFERLRRIVTAILRKSQCGKNFAATLRTILPILDRRKTDRLKVARLLKDYGQRWHQPLTDGVVDAAVIPRVLSFADDFPRVRHVLELAGTPVVLAVMRADRHHFLRHALTSGQFVAHVLPYVAAPEVWGQLEDELLSLPEFGDFFRQCPSGTMSSLTRKMTSADRRKAVWQGLDYRRTFRESFERLDTDLTTDLLQIFRDQNLFDGMDCQLTAGHFLELFRDESSEFGRADGPFTVLFRRVTSPALRRAVLSRIGHATVFRRAIETRNRRPLRVLAACCTDDEKAALRQSVPDRTCLQFARVFVARRDAGMIKTLLRYVDPQECRDVQQALGGGGGAPAAPPGEGDLRDLFKAASDADVGLMLDTLATTSDEFGDRWSAWGHLLYALLKHGTFRRGRRPTV